MADPACLTAALAYAARGWPVLALSPGAKTPLSDKALQPNGSLSASTNPEHIRKLWALYPLAGVGIATGKRSGITVIDLDGPEANKAIKAAGLTIPPTRIHKTRKGYHVLVTYDAALQQGARLLDKLDVRNDGGYIVAPPTVIGDFTYEVFKDREIIPWPEITSLIQANRGHKAAPSSPMPDHPTWVAALLANGAPEGQRNDAAGRIAGYFRSIGIPQDIAIASLLGFARACVPPMDESELRSVVGSIWRYTPSKAHTYQGSVVSVPLVQASAGNTRHFYWPETGVKILVERISEHGRSIDCLLSVMTDAHGDMYGPVHFDLYSENKRTSLRRALQDRLEADWDGMIQRICRVIRDDLGKTDDVVDLGTYVSDGVSPWLVEPILKRAKPILLYGHGGSLKTITANALALSYVTGAEVVSGFKPTSTGRVLYLDFETDKEDSHATVTGLALGAGIAVPKDSLFYWRLPSTLPDHYDRIDRFVRDHEITLVVVDSVVLAAGGDPFTPQGPLTYFTIIRELGVAALGITHTAGGEENSQTPKPYGSVYYWNWSRACWYITNEQEPGSQVASAGLFQTKANRDGKFGPYGMAVDFSDRMIRYGKGDLQAMTQTARHTTTWEQVKGWLRGGAKMKDQLQELMPDTRVDTLERCIRRAIKNGIAIQLGTGAIALPVPDNRTVSGQGVRRGADTSPFRGEGVPHRPSARKPYVEEADDEQKPWGE